MNIDKLIRMANQIAAFFRAYPETEAIAGIRDHIMSFWTPRMRETLLARMEEDEAGLDSLLDPLAGKALQTFRRTRSPIEKEIAGPKEVGQLGSDAG